MTPNEFLAFVADFGDSAVLTALVFTTTIYMLYCRHFSEALALVTALFASSAIIAALKLIMMTCGGGDLDIVSPSGHAALSISVYGTFGLVLMRYFNSWRRAIPALFFFILGFTIAISRVVHNLHSLNEVVLGIIVGVLVVMGISFILLSRKFSLPLIGKQGNFSVYAVIAILIVTAFFVHGHRLPAEKFIKNLAADIKSAIPFC